MRKEAEYTMRQGRDHEKDWVITNRKGKTKLEISRYDLWEIEDRMNSHRQASKFSGQKGIYK